MGDCVEVVNRRIFALLDLYEDCPGVMCMAMIFENFAVWPSVCKMYTAISYAAELRWICEFLVHCEGVTEI